MEALKEMAEQHRNSAFTIKYKLLLSFLALIGVAIVLVSTSRYGIGVEIMGMSYISDARSLLAGKGLATFTVMFPPLYPVLLGAVGYVLGVDPLVSAELTGAFLFGLMVFLAGITAFRYVGSRYVALYAAALVLLSPPLMDVSVMAWPEPLFIGLVLLFLCLVKSYLAKGDWVSLILCSALAALAALTRYLGITLILSGIWIILFLPRNHRRSGIYQLLFFAFVSAVPLGLWALRNYSLSGMPFGPRYPSGFSFFDNMTFALVGIYSALIFSLGSLYPDKFLFHLILKLGFLVLALGFGVFIAYLLRFPKREEWLRMKADRSLWAGPLTVFIAVYTIVLLITSTTTASDKIDNRFLTPLYVPAIILILSLVYQLSRRTARKALISLAALSLMVPLVFVTKNTISYVSHGAGGYSTDKWQESETIRYLRSHALPGKDGIFIPEPEVLPYPFKYPLYSGKGQILSNDPEALYILANINIPWIPRRTASYNSPKIVHELKSLKGTWPEPSEAYLIWIGDGGGSREGGWMFTLDELKTIADIRLYQRFSDGAIYTISRIES
jgi:hypothetical protein